MTAASSFVPDRLVVCLPVRSSLDAALGRAARLARALPESALEVVGTPAHGLQGRRWQALERTLGRRPDVVHLVPRAADIEWFAERRAGRSGLVVTDGRRSWRRRPAGSAVLASSGSLVGRAVLAIADPSHARPVTASTAIELAGRLSASHVLVCRPFFDPSVLCCDECEARVLAREQECLDVSMARVPSAGDVHVAARLVCAPSIERAIARIACEEGAALVVSRDPLALDLPVLRLPEEPGRRDRSRWAMEGAWDRLMAFPSGAA